MNDKEFLLWLRDRLIYVYDEDELIDFVKRLEIIAEKQVDYEHFRDKHELWFDRHNHKMEFLRTLFGFFSATGGILAILRIFGVI